MMAPSSEAESGRSCWREFLPVAKVLRFMLVQVNHRAGGRARSMIRVAAAAGAVLDRLRTGKKPQLRQRGRDPNSGANSAGGMPP